MNGEKKAAQTPTPDLPENDDVTDITSTGPLSNLTRVGIMLSLLGVDRITFSDLLIAVKISKSSLSRSLDILGENGLVKVRRGFSAFGGPRTFVQITEAGRSTTLAHLETLRRVSTKYLESTRGGTDKQVA